MGGIPDVASSLGNAKRIIFWIEPTKPPHRTNPTTQSLWQAITWLLKSNNIKQIVYIKYDKLNYIELTLQ